MPADKIFIDSTTFLYSLDEAERLKRDLSLAWLRSLAEAGKGVTNMQVLNETANVLTKKVHRFPGLDLWAQIDAFSAFGRSPLTWPIALAARGVRSRTGYSWWDSLLLASALELGCTHFLSEDLQGGRAIDGLTIVDPFSTSPGDILLS